MNTGSKVEGILKRTSIEQLLAACGGQMVIGGSMSTALEHMGENLNHKL